MSRDIKGCAMYLLASAVVLLAAASPAWAVDGVFHINQACAVHTGCFEGDDPGFPVTITSSGSYCLTSDLIVGSGSTLDGIDVLASEVTLNLNGFRMTSEGARAAVHIGTSEIAVNDVEVRNGTISNFVGAITAGSEENMAAQGIRYSGIRAVNNSGTALHIAGGKSEISDCIVRNNGGKGIRFWGMGTDGNSSSLSNTIIMSNGHVGLEATNGALVAMSGNKIKDNTYGEVSVNYGGAILELGLNQCGTDTLCP